jgi:hypothetical protein
MRIEMLLSKDADNPLLDDAINDDQREQIIRQFGDVRYIDTAPDDDEEAPNP